MLIKNNRILIFFKRHKSILDPIGFEFITLFFSIKNTSKWIKKRPVGKGKSTHRTLGQKTKLSFFLGNFLELDGYLQYLFVSGHRIIHDFFSMLLNVWGLYSSFCWAEGEWPDRGEGLPLWSWNPLITALACNSGATCGMCFVHVSCKTSKSV